jgi:hypothetical protein
VLEIDTVFSATQSVLRVVVLLWFWTLSLMHNVRECDWQMGHTV